MARQRNGLVELSAPQASQDSESARAQGGADEPNDVQEAPPTLPAPALLAGPRCYHVRLRHSPEAIVHASHPAEAQAKYMRRMNLIATVHPFHVTEVAEGEELPPAISDKPVPTPPKVEPVLIP